MSRTISPAYIGMGGNIGNVRNTFKNVISELRSISDINILDLSSLYRSIPVGGPDKQPEFLNAAIKIETTLSAHNLLNLLMDIEQIFDRKRVVHWGPRTIDLDILIFGQNDEIYDPPTLIIPHPRISSRAFVLSPLKDLDPSLIVPGTGQTVAALYAILSEKERADTQLISEIWDPVHA